MKHNIDAELKRPLQRRGHERVVKERQTAVRLGKLDDPLISVMPSVGFDGVSR